LAENLTHPGHQFWVDDVAVPSVTEDIDTALQGYRQLTDAYLLTLARRRKGTVATFDRGIRTLAGGQLKDVVELVSTR
jgi:predicted nucleic acid-binding protein